MISIITILAGILLPALGRARDSAHRIVCMNNQKQIYLGYSLYAEDNERWICGSDANRYYDRNDFDACPWGWPWGGCGRRLEPYLMNAEVWFCPKHPKGNKELTTSAIPKYPVGDYEWDDKDSTGPVDWDDHGYGVLSYMVPQFSAMDWWVNIRKPLPQPSQVAYQKNALKDDFLTKVYTGTPIKTPLLVEAVMRIEQANNVGVDGPFHEGGVVYTRRSGPVGFYKYPDFPLPKDSAGNQEIERIWEDMAEN